MKKVRLVTITPRMAKRMTAVHDALVEAVGREKANRKPNPDAVNRYSRDMSNDRWVVNGETVKLGNDGRIIDGYQRLLACQKANRPFKTFVIYGLNDEVFSTVDVHNPRNVGFVLSVHGFDNSKDLGTALKSIWNVKNGNWNRKPTNPEIEELAKQHPTLPDYLRLSRSARHVMSVPLAAALWYLHAKEDKAKADAFWGGLVSGTNLVAGSAIHRLRERLIRDHRALQIPGQYDLIVRVWTLKSAQKAA
jgi:hypothetical protein